MVIELDFDILSYLDTYCLSLSLSLHVNTVIRPILFELMYGSEHEWLVNSLNNFFIENYHKDKHRQTEIADLPTVHSDAETVRWMRMCHQGPHLLFWAVCSLFAHGTRWLQR